MAVFSGTLEKVTCLVYTCIVMYTWQGTRKTLPCLIGLNLYWSTCRWSTNLSIYLSFYLYIESTHNGHIPGPGGMLIGVFQGGGGNFSKRIVPFYIMMILTQFTLNGQGRTVRFGRRGQILRHRPGEIPSPPLLVRAGLSYKNVNFTQYFVSFP